MLQFRPWGVRRMWTWGGPDGTLPMRRKPAHCESTRNTRSCGYRADTRGPEAAGSTRRVRPRVREEPLEQWLAKRFPEGGPGLPREWGRRFMEMISALFPLALDARASR